MTSAGEFVYVKVRPMVGRSGNVARLLYIHTHAMRAHTQHRGSDTGSSPGSEHLAASSGIIIVGFRGALEINCSVPGIG
jgi:hypothetical protein